MKIFFLFFLLFAFESRSQNIYFPPLNNNANWDTLSPQSLGWCTDKIDSLYNYLNQENSKAFIALKNGKIVLEKYFGGFTKDSLWYWASAGKTLTSFLVGKAKEEGFLNLTDSTSKFLGQGWTDMAPTKERRITIWNQITMTSGLNDGVPDNHCTIDTCLKYLADAGTRWSYHNAPYTLLEKVIENATGQNINIYTNLKLKNQTGITGGWLTTGFDNIFYSKPRSMARFGILALNKFRWNNISLLSDTAYIHQATNSSQLLNKGYGYLWWLNGKGSFMVPTLQTVFPGSYAPNAPSDMYAALGKNGQIISIAPSSGIVFIRMGNTGFTGEVPFLFCNEIWKRLNKIICANTPVQNLMQNGSKIHTFPNPIKNELSIQFPIGSQQLVVRNLMGKEILNLKISHELNEITIETKNWNPGIFTISIYTQSGIEVKKVIKN